jgi:hypothetical protein
MFQVEWEEPALDDLADLCLLHTDRWADINGAADISEYRLQRDPLKHSHHVAEGLRRIDLSPLAIYFTMNGTTITVESLRWIG